jgi:hypothetical protein
MRTVEHDGDPYLLVKSAEDASLVRDPETGSERYIPNGELTVTGDSPLAVAASAIPEPQRRLLTAVHSRQDLGLLVELDAHGPLAVREILGRYDLCESDLHGRITELRAAGLLRETDIGGEPGYGTTGLTTEALENLQ